MSWVSASGDEGWLLLLLLDEDGGLVSRAMFMYGRRTERLYKGSCAPRKRRRDGAGDYDLKRRGLLGMSAGPRIPRVRSSTYGSEPFDGEIVTRVPRPGSSIRRRTPAEEPGGTFDHRSIVWVQKFPTLAQKSCARLCACQLSCAKQPSRPILTSHIRPLQPAQKPPFVAPHAARRPCL